MSNKVNVLIQRQCGPPLMKKVGGKPTPRPVRVAGRVVSAERHWEDCFLYHGVPTEKAATLAKSAIEVHGSPEEVYRIVLFDTMTRLVCRTRVTVAEEQEPPAYTYSDEDEDEDEWPVNPDE